MVFGVDAKVEDGDRWIVGSRSKAFPFWRGLSLELHCRNAHIHLCTWSILLLMHHRPWMRWIQVVLVPRSATYCTLDEEENIVSVVVSQRKVVNNS